MAISTSTHLRAPTHIYLHALSLSADGRGEATGFTRRLRTELERAGVTCWMDEHGIPAGSDWADVIGDAIEDW